MESDPVNVRLGPSGSNRECAHGCAAKRGLPPIPAFGIGWLYPVCPRRDTSHQPPAVSTVICGLALGNWPHFGAREAGLLTSQAMNRKGTQRDFRGLRSEEHTSELQSLRHLVCRLLLE